MPRVARLLRADRLWQLACAREFRLEGDAPRAPALPGGATPERCFAMRAASLALDDDDRRRLEAGRTATSPTTTTTTTSARAAGGPRRAPRRGRRRRASAATDGDVALLAALRGAAAAPSFRAAWSAGARSSSRPGSRRAGARRVAFLDAREWLALTRVGPARREPRAERARDPRVARAAGAARVALLPLAIGALGDGGVSWRFERGLVSLRLLYAIHAGQELSYDNECDAGAPEHARHNHTNDIFAGLFGGYSAYNHFVCSRLYPPRRAGRQSRRLNDQRHVALVTSYNLNKLFVLRRDGAVLSGDRRTRAAAGAARAAPRADGGLTRWFCEYARRVTACPHRPAAARHAEHGIVLFPKSPPMSSPPPGPPPPPPPPPRQPPPPRRRRAGRRARSRRHRRSRARCTCRAPAGVVRVLHPAAAARRARGRRPGDGGGGGGARGAVARGFETCQLRTATGASPTRGRVGASTARA